MPLRQRGSHLIRLRVLHFFLGVLHNLPWNDGQEHHYPSLLPPVQPASPSPIGRAAPRLPLAVPGTRDWAVPQQHTRNRRQDYGRAPHLPQACVQLLPVRQDIR